MTDPTLPTPQPSKDKKNAPQPPLNEVEKFEDIFKTIDIDAPQTNTTPHDLPVQTVILPPTKPSKINEEAGKNKVLIQDAPPVEPELTGIKDIGNYIAKAKENQSKKVTRLEAEDGTDLTKLSNIYAVVPHTKGDHKLIYTYDKAPTGLLDDPKQRTPGTSYIKNNELIYDVWVTMKKHPTLKNERNEPLDVWLIDTPDQLTQQLTSIAIGKGGGTNFSKPLIIEQPQKSAEVTKKPKEVITPPQETQKETRVEDKDMHMEKQVPAVSTPAQVPESLPPAQAPESSPPAQAPASKVSTEKPAGLSPEAKKTIKDTMAHTEKKQMLPPSLSKNFSAPKTSTEKQTPPPVSKQSETVKPPIAPKQDTTKTSASVNPTQTSKLPPKTKSPATPVPTNKVIVETQETPTTPKTIPLQVPQAKEEKIIMQTLIETTPIPEAIQQTTSTPAEMIPEKQEVIIPAEQKETTGDTFDLDSLDNQELKTPETPATLDLESLDTQFAKKVVVHPKGSSVPIGMILRIMGVIMVISMSRAMYTVMFPSVPQRPTNISTGTDLPLNDDTPSLVDDIVTTGSLPEAEQNTGTYGMPTKEEGEDAAKNAGHSDTFTFEELAAKLTAQQKTAQTIANKAKLLNDKEAIKFSIVSIRKAGEALQRIEDDPSITASELTDIATKIDLYLQEAELRIQ